MNSRLLISALAVFFVGWTIAALIDTRTVTVYCPTEPRPTLAVGS